MSPIRIEIIIGDPTEQVFPTRIESIIVDY